MRINWGQLAKKPQEAQLATVREWLGSHQPSDAGYQPAARWLSRREQVQRTNDRLRPALVKQYEEFQKSDMEGLVKGSVAWAAAEIRSWRR